MRSKHKNKHAQQGLALIWMIFIVGIAASWIAGEQFYVFNNTPENKLETRITQLLDHKQAIRSIDLINIEMGKKLNRYLAVLNRINQAHAVLYKATLILIALLTQPELLPIYPQIIASIVRLKSFITPLVSTFDTSVIIFSAEMMSSVDICGKNITSCITVRTVIFENDEQGKPHNYLRHFGVIPKYFNFKDREYLLSHLLPPNLRIPKPIKNEPSFKENGFTLATLPIKKIPEVVVPGLIILDVSINNSFFYEHQFSFLKYTYPESTVLREGLEILKGERLLPEESTLTSPLQIIDPKPLTLMLGDQLLRGKL